MTAGVILLVDNRQMYADTRAEILRRKGYVVYCAYSPDQAREILRTKWVNLAILDNRLIDDDDPEDQSGLDLAKEPEFSHIAKMIVTGFPSVEIVRDALTPNQQSHANILRFRSKTEPIEDVLKDVAEIFETHIQINHQLKFHWKHPSILSTTGLIMQFDASIPADELAGRIGEMDDLLRIVFYKYDQITIARILWVREDRLAIDVVAFSGNQSSQFILQLQKTGTQASSGQPGNELHKADVSIQFSSVHYVASAWRLERSLSEFISLVDFIHENGEKRLITVLENLYLSSLAPWHQLSLNVIEGDPAEFYRSWFGMPPVSEMASRLELKMHHLFKACMAAKLIVDYQIDDTSINLQFGKLEKELKLTNPKQTFMVAAPLKRSYRCIPSPGNVRMDTLLADHSAMVSLTDFSKPEYVPCELNFITMELDVRVRECGTDNLLKILELERELSNLQDLTGIVPSTNVDPDCRKALVMILTLRRLAHQIFQSSFQDYSNGLFHASLQPILDLDESLHYMPDDLMRFLHYLLILGFIAETGSRSSAKSELPKAQRGIQVDEKNHEVLLHGNPVNLTPTEYDLLLFLYNKRGELCRREEIMKQVFNFDDPDPNTEKSLLNTHMGRLRTKIEADAGNPVYIITVRSLGYKLVIDPD